VTDLLAAASAALGVALTEPVALASSDRSSVLRCLRPGGGTVVVKSYPANEEGAEGFAAEAAGLEFTTGTRIGPDLLAADPAERVIVMSDLGDAPSLATLLLGSLAAPARTALLDWAKACGRLAVSTSGRDHEFASLIAGQQASLRVRPQEKHWLLRRLERTPVLLEELSVELRGNPAGLADDLAAVATLLGPGQCPVFSPGDICPDNNLITSEGVRFIDFESAEFHSVFLDAAYLRMPFSSCWCVSRLPDDLAAEAEAAYRALVSAAYPELADEAHWQRGIRLATAAWTLHAMSYLLDRSMIADRLINLSESRSPTARQLLRYRWQVLLAELEGTGELPAISVLMRQLLTSTESWQVPEMPGYPAFS
jgi:hypothetical protein